MTDYEALFTKADADLKDANERYSQAAVDSMDAAFRGLVFGCAAEGVTEIELEPSDQGDYMSINELTAPDDVDVDTIMENLWNFASDLTDYPDAPWRILAGVTIPETRGTVIVTIDVKVAASALAESLPEPMWTFVGHWDNDEIVVEYVLAGEHQDPREDIGFWEQGLFAASASGTQEEALAKVRDEYETHTCRGCGRDELTCSQDPCPDVVADRNA